MSRTSIFRLSVSVLVVAAAATGIFLATRQRLPADLREAAPRDSVALVHLRPAQLLETKAFDQLVRQRGLDAGMTRVEELCGFNPVAQVDEALLFAFPVSDDTWPQWGALLRGDMDPRELAECVKTTLQSSGRESALQQASVRGIPCAVSSQGDSRACAVWDGLILGSEAAVDGAIAAMLGDSESALSRPALAEPWDELSDDADVRAAGVIPQSTRDVLSGIVRPFLPPSLASVTAVKSIWGELDAGGDTLIGEALFETQSAEDAKAVAQTFEFLISRLRDSAAIILTPARTLLHQTKVETDGLRVRVRGDYPLHALGTVMDLLPMATRVLGGLSGGGPDPAHAQPGPDAGAAPPPPPADAPPASDAKPEPDAPGQP